MENYLKYMTNKSKWFEDLTDYIDDWILVDNVPKKWEASIIQHGYWKVCMPPINNMPDQGWKIHISVNFEEIQKLLNIITPYLFENEIPFKHIASYSMYKLNNSKNGNRISSGKFLVIYSNDDTFVKVINDMISPQKAVNQCKIN